MVCALSGAVGQRGSNNPRDATVQGPREIWALVVRSRYLTHTGTEPSGLDPKIAEVPSRSRLRLGAGLSQSQRRRAGGSSPGPFTLPYLTPPHLFLCDPAEPKARTNALPSATPNPTPTAMPTPTLSKAVPIAAPKPTPEAMPNSNPLATPSLWVLRSEFMA